MRGAVEGHGRLACDADGELAFVARTGCPPYQLEPLHVSTRIPPPYQIEPLHAVSAPTVEGHGRLACKKRADLWFVRFKAFRLLNHHSLCEKGVMVWQRE